MTGKHEGRREFYLIKARLELLRVFHSKTFHKILPECCKSAEVGKLIVSGMKEALKQAQRDRQIDVSETILYTTGEIAR